MSIPARQVTGIELSLTLERLVRLIRELSTSAGLSPTAATVLGRLDVSGPQRLTELARATGGSQPAMTQLVGRMERDGLVSRTVTKGDRRGVLVELSHHGKEILAARRAQRAVALEQLLDHLDDDDQAAIASALPALGRLVDALTTG